MSDEKLVHLRPRTNPLKIEPGKVVTLKYALFHRDSGELLEYRDDLVYLHGGYEPRLPRLQQAMEGFEVGFKTEVELTAEEGFGAYDPNLVITGGSDEFPAEARQPGTVLDGEAPDGTVIQFRVTRVEDDTITVDGNHPLAGLPLRFVVEIVAIREATAEEIEAGHAWRDKPAPEPGPELH